MEDREFVCSECNGGLLKQENSYICRNCSSDWKIRNDFLNVDEKVKVIYNAVDIDQFNPCVNGNKIKDEFGVKNGVLVGIVGRVSPLKRQEDFLYGRLKC